jgi:hypothetical protein
LPLDLRDAIFAINVRASFFIMQAAAPPFLLVVSSSTSAQRFYTGGPVSSRICCIEGGIGQALRRS